MWLAMVARPSVPANSLHQVLWGYFPGVPDGSPRPFVYRVERDRILLLSRIPPACAAQRVDERIEAGRVYQFRALVSPANGSGKDGRRRPIEGNEKRREWLGRRLHGARLTFAQLFERRELRFKRPGGDLVTVHRCEAVGTLQVIDREVFIETMVSGIGGRGCWGCGLLVLPEIMEVGDGRRIAA